MTLAARAGAVGASWATRFDQAIRLDSSHGELFRARDKVTGRAVQVKLAGRTAPAARDGLVREATVLAKVGAHPHVQTMYERIDAGRTVALVFERCLGRFADLFGHHPSPVRETVAIGVKVAGALETIHRAGYVHSAIDPRNLLLTEWAEPVVANLGSSVPVQGSFGTVDEPTVHTAPEVLLGEEIGPATDVYGLASVLYLLLTGRPAITASAGHAAAAVSASVLRSSVAPVVQSDVPLDLSDLLVWSLSTDPLSRPPTAIWFGEELRRIEKTHGWGRTTMMIESVAQ